MLTSDTKHFQEGIFQKVPWTVLTPSPSDYSWDNYIAPDPPFHHLLWEAIIRDFRRDRLGWSRCLWHVTILDPHQRLHRNDRHCSRQDKVEKPTSLITRILCLTCLGMRWHLAHSGPLVLSWSESPPTTFSLSLWH